jgi:GTPase involved in cell partitioning and DNA repair
MLFQEKDLQNNNEQITNSKFDYNSESDNDLIIKFFGTNTNTKQFYIISTCKNENIENIIITVKTIIRNFGWHNSIETNESYNINNILLFFNVYKSLINNNYNDIKKIGVDFRGKSKEKLVDFVEILKTEYISYICKI